ncbi:lytic transglycosylase domain-containing protein [Pseudomonas japonica]|uniref:lytic transglycosylase domain-containing protein n=1 Tax=Pseudomonas japonica TaxID=256466 RepID=UPI0015E37B47|nr:lytic transglycosylase domain-containing protein [Pseudomonas japonica]MBA1290664.1 lytic transglycosylase domain-containing protein [Pseudomonas japonica]
MLSTSAFLALAMQCAPSIHPATLTPIVKTESSFNPWAIGVVGGALPRQPQSLDEAVLTVKKLVGEGANFSIGLGQINRQHFDVSHPETMFEPCTNLRMTAQLLQDCYTAAAEADPDPQGALRKAISCYYSGNLTRGFQAEAGFGGSSHVQRVLANADITVPALEGGTAELAPRQRQRVSAEPVTAAQPVYEGWDVLRQYPRYPPPAPVSAPSAPPAVSAVPASTPQETSPTVKEDQ